MIQSGERESVSSIEFVLDGGRCGEQVRRASRKTLTLNQWRRRRRARRRRPRPILLLLILMLTVLALCFFFVSIGYLSHIVLEDMLA